MSKKHMILMVLCCVFGMGAAAAILFFRIPVNQIVYFALLLVCPLSHLFMMKFMMKDGHEHGAHEPHPTENVHAHPASAQENN